jgi:hypothetical protein
VSKIPEWAMEMARDLVIYPEVGEDGRPYLASDDHETIALALVAAEKRGIERAAKLIEEGYDRPVATPWGINGASKNDLCPHGMAVYQDCEQCAAAAIRQLGEPHD